MNKQAIVGLIGAILISQLSGQEVPAPGKEVSLFGFLQQMSAYQLEVRSDSTINNRGNNGLTGVSNFTTLADVTVPAIPDSTVYEPSLHWILIVFITFMSIMLLLVGGMYILRETVMKNVN